MNIHRYEIDICEACIRLEGEMCNTPGCVFCWLGMGEVERLLRRTDIRIAFDDGTIYKSDPIKIFSNEDNE